MTVAQMIVRIGADIADAQKGLDTISGRLSNVGKEAAKTGALLSAGVTAPLGLLAKSALDTAMDYQSSLNMMQAVSGATSEQMQQVAKRAKELGADMTLPATSAGDAAKAMTELAKAGLSVDDTLGAAKGVLQLAAAGNLSEAQAAEIAANALNAFHLQGTEATRVADLLAAAANASSGEVTDMADSLKMSAAVFASSNVPIEELVASIGQMANAGIKGSDAGTSLKQMLLSLQAPTDKAQKLMDSLGINIYDAQGKMLPFGDIIGQFSGKLGNLTQEQRNQALATIFGSDAVRAANIVMMGGVDAHKQMLDAVTRQGAAADLAGARMKGLGGALEGLKSQVETVLLDVAEPFLATLEGWARTLADLVPKISEIDPNLRNAALAFAAVLAAAGPAIAIFGALAAAVAFVLSPIGLVVLAIAALAAAWVTDFGGIREITAAVFGFIQNIVQAVIGFISPFIQTELGVITSWWDENFGLIQAATQNVMTFISNIIQFVLGQIAAFWQAHGEQVMTILQAAWAIITTIIDTALQIVLNLIKLVMQLITGDWSGAWQTIQTILQIAWDGIQTIVGSALTIITTTLSLAWDGIKTTAEAAWNGIWDAIKGVWNGIQTAIQDVLGRDDKSGIRGYLSGAWDSIKSVAESAWNGIWGAIKAVINDIIRGINVFIRAWNSIELSMPPVHIETPLGNIDWGGFSIGTPDVGLIPTLATGGIVTRPTLALVGEAGPEAVVPLSGSRLDALAERIATAVARRPTYTINASYRYQDERSLRDDLRLLQLLGAAT